MNDFTCSPLRISLSDSCQKELRNKNIFIRYVCGFTSFFLIYVFQVLFLSLLASITECLLDQVLYKDR